MNDNQICFQKRANSGLFFGYFCPFLISISILQIEKSVNGVSGFKRRAAVW